MTRLTLQTRDAGPKKWLHRACTVLLLILLLAVIRLQGQRDWSTNILIAAKAKDGLNTASTFRQAELYQPTLPPSFRIDDSVKSKVTLVTAFFPLDGSTRHTLNEYIDYMTKLFSNKDAMIVFTSHRYAPTMRNLMLNATQGTDQARIVIPMHLNETRSWNMFPDDFWYSNVYQPSRKIRSLGSNKGIIDHWPYIVWNSKVEFLKLASDQNPFQSQFFAWIDAGFLRWDRYTHSTIVQRIPPELSTDKLLIMDVTPILSHKKYKQMSAGMFGGYKPAIDRYYEKYYQIMEDAGNSKDAPLLSTEQFLLHRTCLRSPGLCHMVVPMESNTLGPALKHPYFYMLAYFHAIEHKIMELNGKIHPCNGMDQVEGLEECVENGAAKNV